MPRYDRLAREKKCIVWKPVAGAKVKVWLCLVTRGSLGGVDGYVPINSQCRVQLLSCESTCLIGLIDGCDFIQVPHPSGRAGEPVVLSTL